MIFSAIISFLGGSAFRMIWGEVSSYFNSKQEHTQELDRMRIQGQLDAEAHSRNMDSMRLQADLGVKEIRVKSEADLAAQDATGWYSAIQEAMKPSGIKWVDAWNGCIRPMCATIAISLWIVAIFHQSGAMTEWDQELMASVIGFFFADRTLGKRGK